jgi:hypothetical protein
MSKSGTSVSNPLNGIIHREYFSKVKDASGLSNGEVKVEKHDTIPWNTDVYFVGGIRERNGNHVARVAWAYRSQAAPKGEFDEHGKPVVIEEKIEENYDEKSVVGFLESMITGLRKKTDFPK